MAHCRSCAPVVPPAVPGWYKLCDSRDMPLGSTKHVTLLGKETAIFRGLGDAQQEAGTVYCVDAVCPHLGANMGRGGKVVENKIEWSDKEPDSEKRRRGANRSAHAVSQRIRIFRSFPLLRPLR